MVSCCIPASSRSHIGRTRQDSRPTATPSRLHPNRLQVFYICSTSQSMPESPKTLRIARGRLIFLALCAVDEVIGQLGSEPQKPTVAMRLAMAFLYACSDGRREPYDSFWKVLGDPYDWSNDAPGSTNGRAYVRRTYAGIHFKGICRSVGIEPTVKFEHSLSEARNPEARRRARMADAVKGTAIERAEIDEKARKARQYDLSD